MKRGRGSGDALARVCVRACVNIRGTPERAQVEQLSYVLRILTHALRTREIIYTHARLPAMQLFKIFNHDTLKR